MRSGKVLQSHPLVWPSSADQTVCLQYESARRDEFCMMWLMWVNCWQDREVEEPVELLRMPIWSSTVVLDYGMSRSETTAGSARLQSLPAAPPEASPWLLSKHSSQLSKEETLSRLNAGHRAKTWQLLWDENDGSSCAMAPSISTTLQENFAAHQQGCS